MGVLATYLELGVLVTIFNIAFVNVSYKLTLRSYILNLLITFVSSCSIALKLG